jgi:hypothetical protein
LEVPEVIPVKPKYRQTPHCGFDNIQRREQFGRELPLWVNSCIVKPVDFEQVSDLIRQLGYYCLLLDEQPWMREFA